MDEQELKDIFELLEKQGWKPMLCDTPVPFYDGRVPCGKPNGVGEVECELAMMSREYLPMNRVFMVTVTGESMRDANIFAGDVVLVESGASVSDGDIVLVNIDGECTLKTYCEDENGNPWLVPQNPEYDAFPLEENQSIYVAGKVRQIIRQAPRIKYKSCMKFIKAAKAKMAEPEEISQVQISKAIREIAPTITVARQWYAVYRVMADLNIVREDDFDTFIDMVKAEVPRHKNLPQRAEMQRMAVDSFSKPLALWRPENAPVQGKRYNDYLAIAQKTKEMLRR